jgi:GWxTD domain-containing protein
MKYNFLFLFFIFSLNAADTNLNVASLVSYDQTTRGGYYADVHYQVQSFNKMNAVTDSFDVFLEVFHNDSLIIKGWHEIGHVHNGVFRNYFRVKLGSQNYRTVVTLKSKNRNLSESKSINLALSSASLTNGLVPLEYIVRDSASGSLVYYPKFNNYYVAGTDNFIYYQEYYLPATESSRPFIFAIRGQHNNGEWIDLIKKRVPADNSVANMVGAINLSPYQFGKWKLISTLTQGGSIFHTDSAVVSLVDNREKEFVRNVEIIPEYHLYSNDELYDEVVSLRYILNENLYKQMKLASRREKMVMLTRFWKQNEANNSGEEYEFRKYYLELITYARENFSYSNRDGIDTDRGRVLLKYGRPDEIIDLSKYSKNDVDDILMWQYTKNYSGVIFLFQRQNYVGEYILVHSTMDGEIYSHDWVNFLESTEENFIFKKF